MNWRHLLLSLLLALWSTSSALTQPIVTKSDEIVWLDRPGGVRVAVLYGDPEKPGPFVLRLQYPAGYRKAPHYHPNDAFVTVLAGKYYRGYGNEVNPSDAIELTPGTFSVNPAGVSHYEWTTERAELQVHATGPWASVYVDVDGNPSSAPPEHGMPR